MAWKEISAISQLSLAVMLALPTASASIASISDLLSTVSSFDDRMDAEDLAFYLAAHGIDVKPQGDCAEVYLDDDIYQLTLMGSSYIKEKIHVRDHCHCY